MHHVLTSFALGATPETLQKHYENGSSYQRSQPSLNNDIVKELHDPTKFVEQLTNADNYPAYLAFFQEELAKHGHEKVLNEYVFKGDTRANIMFNRLYAGEFCVALAGEDPK